MEDSPAASAKPSCTDGSIQVVIEPVPIQTAKPVPIQTTESLSIPSWERLCPEPECNDTADEIAEEQIAAMRTLAIAAQLQTVRFPSHKYHRKTGRVRMAREHSDSGSFFSASSYIT